MKVCRWTETDEKNLYHTTCEGYYLTPDQTPDQTPEQLGFKFCMYCGGELLKDEENGKK